MTQTFNRHDEAIKTAVVAELRWTPDINDTRIGVAVNNGAVSLSGEVDTYPQLLLASKAAQRVPGVTALAQELTVHGKWSSANDTDIAREAGEALARSVDVPDRVKVEVSDHFITLSGTVTWQHERQSAERSVRYLKGVQGVRNDIAVKPTVATDGLKSSIDAALVRTAVEEGKHITVTADQAGVVTLEGTVGSFAERRQAQHVAWSAPGVTGLNDHLVVTY
jgi:osmotically-inducible protein OsmY